MILDRIVAGTREIVTRRAAQAPMAELIDLAAAMPAPRDFARALRAGGTIAVIAEIKRASPSKGNIRADLDPRELAIEYERGGAAAVSVLTEPDYFRGSLDDLAAARSAVTLPVMRKDFIIDPYQVWEARAHGADAFLLIVAALDQGKLRELLAIGRQLGMEALVEVHDEAEVERALAADASVIGVNNRNLADFTVDISTAARLRRLIPTSITVVGESGIHTAEDVAMLARAGLNAILVGEALVTSADPAARLRELLCGAKAGLS